MLAPRAVILAPLLLCAACQDGTTPPDAGVDLLAPPPDLLVAADLVEEYRIKLSGRTVGLTGVPVPNTTIGVLEEPGRTVTADGVGRFTFQVLPNRTTTLFVTAPGYARTVEQEIIFLRDTADFYLPLARQEEYDALQQLGGGGAQSGVIGLVASALSGCSPVGATLGTNPRTGTVLYAGTGGDGGASWLPDPALQSVQDGPLIQAFVTGTSGRVTPTLQSATCMLAFYPVSVGHNYQVTGAIEVQPGSYHDAQVFTQ